MIARNATVFTALAVCAGGLGCSDDSASSVAPTDMGVLEDAEPDAGADAGSEDVGATPDGGRPDGGPPTGFALHYHRPDLSYDGWSVVLAGDVRNAGTIPLGGVNGFGGVFPVELAPDAAVMSFQFTNGQEVEPAQPVTIQVPAGGAGLWWFDGFSSALSQPPPAIPGPNQVAIYYARRDAAYTGWGLQLTEEVAQPTATPTPFGGVDDILGAWWLVDLAPGGDRVGLVVQRGDERDPGPDMGFNVSQLGNIVFLRSGSDEVFTVPQVFEATAIENMEAHWVQRDLILYQGPPLARFFELWASENAEIELNERFEITGGERVPLALSEEEVPASVARAFPRIADRRPLRVPTASAAEDLLHKQLVVVARDQGGGVLAATQVQIPGVLDDIYAFGGRLGVTYQDRQPSLRLWAPTAQAVQLIRYNADLEELARGPMTEEPDGTWTISGDPSWNRTYYRYLITVYHPMSRRIETFEVSDPYSVGLSADGTHSQFLDLAGDVSLQPTGWDNLALPPLDDLSDVVIYEGHLREFSSADPSSAASERGKYGAFTSNGQGANPTSLGMSHLENLALAGVNVLQLLPINDVVGVAETPSARVDIEDSFDALCSANPSIPVSECTRQGSNRIFDVLLGADTTTTTAQQVAAWLKDVDSHDWGLDALHYLVPDGAYAEESADSARRVLEVREMVQALAEIGLRTGIEFSFNHTPASGPSSPFSILDKVVPGYYHRLDEDTGEVQRLTGGADTASEHFMMSRLMSDAVRTWTQEYKVGAIRIDQMAQHTINDMALVRVTADTVDPSIYVYGEDSGAADLSGEEAVPSNLAGTRIGALSPTLRDAVRGGRPSDVAPDVRIAQGFATGLFYAPNELNSGSAAEETTLLQLADAIRVGMAASLGDFAFIDRGGTRTTGGSLIVNGSTVGYADAPFEAVNYVSRHAGPTLYDIGAYKLATGTAIDERLRRHNFAIGLSVFAQGIPSLHMGVDLLRSKSMHRSSQDAGDWFNRIDWARSATGWNIGLPGADTDAANWSLITTILMDSSVIPGKTEIERAASILPEMLRVRGSTPLFRLRTKQDVLTRIDYHNTGPQQTPGLIVQSITDGTCAGIDLDPNLDAVVVIANGTPTEQSFDLAGAGAFALHPSFAASQDVVRNATYDLSSGRFTVPALTIAVFQEAQMAAQGAGLPCNTR